jgi:hypothetical protein
VRRVVLGELVHRRARTFALLLGILVATAGFTVLAGTSESQRLEVRGTVNRAFRGDYDVLVRPRGARNSIERRTQQVQPNFLSGIFGGITERQWRTIAGLPGVDVAAPIANVGYVFLTGTTGVDLSRVAGRRGRVLLRARVAWRTDRGLTRLPDASVYLYVTDHLLRNPGRQAQRGHLPSWIADAPRERPRPGARPLPVCPVTYYIDHMWQGGPFSWKARSRISCFGRRPPIGRVEWSPWRRGAPRIAVNWAFPLLLSAIDPDAEARLTGLSGAVANGRALRASDRITLSEPVRDFVEPSAEPSRFPELPVIAVDRTPLDQAAEVTVERLPGASAQGMLRRHWSEADSIAMLRYLHRQPRGRVVSRHRIAGAAAYARLLRDAARSPMAWNTDGWLVRPGPVRYRARAEGLTPGARPRATALTWGYDQTLGT